MCKNRDTCVTCVGSVTGGKKAVIASEAKQAVPFYREIASSFQSSQ